MKKLTLSLVLSILTAIIFLGWSLDSFFNQYQQKDSDELSAYRQIIMSLGKTLDATSDLEQFVANWQKHNQQQLLLTPVKAFPLPVSLREDFNQGQPLVLQSEEQITINQLLPSHGQVLTLTMPALSKQEDDLTLQIALTTVFYSGILLCVFIWLYPLIKRLRLLRSATKSFGEGDFSKRITLSSTSYIADIENEFNRMAEKINILVEDNKLLSNAVSHDLRTPLARLRFGIEALGETHNPKNKEKYIRHLSQDIEEMENLVSVLLNYARLEQKMIQLERQEIKLNELITSSVRNLTLREPCTISVDTSDLSASPISINGDENYLSMLINNLLANAQRYAVKHIRISTQQTNHSITMSICDDGPGIPLEKRENMFKPFTRGEENPEQSGYGMGLAIVARIAEWHKAQVNISQSKTLGGAKFVVEFKQ